jgi:hypothetical protein
MTIVGFAVIGSGDETIERCLACEAVVNRATWRNASLSDQRSSNVNLAARQRSRMNRKLKGHLGAFTARNVIDRR